MTTIPAQFEHIASITRAALNTGKPANLGFAPGNAGRYHLVLTDLAGVIDVHSGHNKPGQVGGLLVVGFVPHRFSFLTPASLAFGDHLDRRWVTENSGIPEQVCGDTLVIWALVNLLLDVPASQLEGILDEQHPDWAAAVDRWDTTQQRPPQ